MPGITVSSFVNAPAERVFAAYCDFEHASSFVSAITRVEMLTPGPVRAGTKFRETRVMMGKEATEEMTVAEFDPPRRYALTASSCGTDYTSTFLFTPEGAGTRVSCEFEGRPRTALARVLGVVMMPMMKGMLRKCVSKDMDDVRAHLEGAEA